MILMNKQADFCSYLKAEGRIYMIIRESPVELKPEYTFEQDPESLVFFDIETTGFAAETTYLYLIGCIYYKSSSFYMKQWFSEDISEEEAIIRQFLDFIRNYGVLVHYNGSGFDIPYLLKKCSMYGITPCLDNMISLDIYKEIAPYKRLFRFKNYKQRTIEAFLNVKREDIFDGGDLIQVYAGYLGRKRIERLKKSRNADNEAFARETEAMLEQLLLHNRDDLKGLVRISPILYYPDMLRKPIRIQQAGVNNDELIIRFMITPTLPVRISCGNDAMYFSAYENSACLTVKIYEGEHKHFYDNYKDYYYLPAEDRAIHKSLAIYVDKDFRERAKPSTCYVKKQGIFAPQYTPYLSPCFRKDFGDKLAFLEIHTDFLLKEETLEMYTLNMIAHLIAARAIS